MSTRPDGEINSKTLSFEVETRIRRVHPLVSEMIIRKVVWQTLQVLSEWQFVELEVERAVEDGNRH